MRQQDPLDALLKRTQSPTYQQPYQREAPPAPKHSISEGQFEYVDVEFLLADTDHAVKHNLRPARPEDVRYQVVRANRACMVYDDQSLNRKPWPQSAILIRCNVAPAKVRLKLFTEMDSAR